MNTIDRNEIYSHTGNGHGGPPASSFPWVCETAAGNFLHPKEPQCLKWVCETWRELSMAGVKKKAESLGMTADLGPEFPYYKPEEFEDVQPAGEEEEVLDQELADDLENAAK